MKYIALLQGSFHFEHDIYSRAHSPKEYWGEIPQNEFEELLNQIEHHSSFPFAILKYFENHPRRDLYPYITDILGRCAWHQLLSKPPRGIAVDLGAGLGAISEGLAQSYEQVFSLEGCFERCRFLAMRKQHQNLNNVEIVHQHLDHLPFPDESLDLLACNGVLEWVGWMSPGNVAQIQSCFLKEINRVLKKNGILYIGIENRFAQIYFRGAPDHPGTKYTSLVPRFMANMLSAHTRHNPGFSAISPYPGYRTFTYSWLGYRRLLQAAGFPFAECYCAEPSYDIPRYAFSWSALPEEVDFFTRTFMHHGHRHWFHRLLCTNYFIFASKQDLIGRVVTKPIFFGFRDYLILEGKKIKRESAAGYTHLEPLIPGISALKAGRPKLQTEEVVSAYEQFLQQSNRYHQHLPAEGIEAKLATVAADLLDPKTLRRVVNRIYSDFSKGPYHGDFWIGNLIIASNHSELILIDSELHLFGSRQLDILDFGLDFHLSNRRTSFPNFDFQKLARHFDVDWRDSDLIMAAILRQIFRYSPFHRSHSLVYEYRKLLREYHAGRITFEFF